MSRWGERNLYGKRRSMRVLYTKLDHVAGSDSVRMTSWVLRAQRSCPCARQTFWWIYRSTGYTAAYLFHIKIAPRYRGAAVHLGVQVCTARPDRQTTAQYTVPGTRHTVALGAIYVLCSGAVCFVELTAVLPGRIPRYFGSSALWGGFEGLFALVAV